MNTSHGAHTSLRNNGNDGWAGIDEDPDGTVIIAIDGDPETLRKLVIMVNGERSTLTLESDR